MASGEIRLEGAEAYLVGQQDQGLKQMMEQVNLSRLSHGVRAAAMMRRCVNEALAAARGRTAFGRTVADFPLMRRQLMKMLVPAEQALSMALCTADALGRGAREELRILTGLLKLRACRDNVTVATGCDGGARRQRLYRGLGEPSADPRRPGRVAVGGHQQHQRTGRDRPGGGQGGGASCPAGDAARTAGGGFGVAGVVPDGLGPGAGSCRRTGRTGSRPGTGDVWRGRRRPRCTTCPARCCWRGKGRGVAPTRGGRCWPALSWRTGCRRWTRWRRTEADWERPATDALLGEKPLPLQDVTALLM